jgi:hypothetical protein
MSLQGHRAVLEARMPHKRIVTVSTPYPLVDPGEYLATCIEATFDWARQWKKWMAILVMELQNYAGRPYQGKLCKFLSLGRDQNRPFAGQHSAFRQLWVELNGGQPPGPEVTMQIFENRLYQITVETVKQDRNGKERPAEHWYSVVREIHLAPPPLQHPNTAILNSSTQRTQSTHSTDQHSNTENTPLTEERGQESFLRSSERNFRG